MDVSTLAGLSPDTALVLVQPQMFEAMSSFLLAIIGVIVIISVICWMGKQLENRKSTDYRKLVMDMYVAGAIRKFADEDKISLDDEFKNFKKWDKIQKSKGKDLDNVVEENLNEKITDKVDKEINNEKVLDLS